MSSRFVILNPCSKRWDQLEGDGRERFCATCQTPVHDIEQYSASEWKELWTKNRGHVCGYRSSAPEQDRRSRRSVLIGALLTAVSPLMAQSGRVRIKVKDATGAVMSRASAELLGADDKAIRSVDADENGDVIFTDLPMGNNRFRVYAPGFNSEILSITSVSVEEVKTETSLTVGSMGSVMEYKSDTQPTTMPISGSLPDSSTSTPAVTVMGVVRKRRRWWLFGR